jgi:hypothetical protein
LSKTKVQSKPVTPKVVPPEDVLDKRVELLEVALGQSFESLEKAAAAINRLEVFTFSLIKVLHDVGSVDLDVWALAQRELQKFEDLHDYWGVQRAPPVEPGS